MRPSCPTCSLLPQYIIDSRTIVRHGRFYRTSDSKSVERFLCKHCGKTFSKATLDPCFRQKKRQKNREIFEQLASGTSQRRTARLKRVNRKTVARKLIFLGLAADEKLRFDNQTLRVSDFQFDDLETLEHTKLKPVSVTLAVEHPTRRILGFRVASMPAKGLLAKRSLKKYGPRRDERTKMRRELFHELSSIVAQGALIRSDSNPYYPADVKTFFPGCHHVTTLGRRGATTGQGELKKIVFDPLFSLNHTCAMFRYGVSALIRKTWCTSKKRENLRHHLSIYAAYHNQHLH